MPELPEVETIARALREGGREGPPIVGWVTTGAELLWARTLALPAPEQFMSRLPGQTILDIGRRGKFIIIQLDHDALLFHLRMSGDLRVETNPNVPGEAHDRLVIHFSEGKRLAFDDARKFGRAWLTSDPAEVLAGLGPEPFDPDFSAGQLYTMLHARHRQLKPLLLDQTFLAGLGNIYTDEALHLAGLHPNRASDRLSPDEAARLWDAIRHVLADGIQRNGASIDWAYRGGSFQNTFRVYQRTGQPCPVCGHPIERTLVGQRGTHYCPQCQPKEV